MYVNDPIGSCNTCNDNYLIYQQHVFVGVIYIGATFFQINNEF